MSSNSNLPMPETGLKLSCFPLKPFLNHIYFSTFCIKMKKEKKAAKNNIAKVAS
jgi:hypothetical protein